METNLTSEMERVLEIAIGEGFVCAGAYYTNRGSRERDIAASTLRALASRGLLAVGLSPDGGMCGRPTNAARALAERE